MRPSPRPRPFPFLSVLMLWAVATLAGASCSRQPPAPKGLGLDEVERRLAAGQLKVYDANLKHIFEKHHLPGARWVQFDAVTAADLPADREAPLLFYCANEMCSASTEAAEKAVALGHRQVFHMPAGIYGWKRAGKRVEKGTP